MESRLPIMEDFKIELKEFFLNKEHYERFRERHERCTFENIVEWFGFFSCVIFGLFVVGFFLLMLFHLILLIIASIIDGYINVWGNIIETISYIECRLK